MSPKTVLKLLFLGVILVFLYFFWQMSASGRSGRGVPLSDARSAGPLTPPLASGKLQKELGTKLRKAASLGDVASVQDLLLHGADVNSEGPKKETPLGEAIKQGQSEVVKILLKRGADPNTRAPGEWSLLHWIVGSSQGLDLLHLALKNKVDVNAADDGIYPLYTAVTSGPALVDALLHAGAGINCRNGHRQMTPLHRAVYNSPSVAKLLIKRGADLKAKTTDGRTALDLLEQGPMPEHYKAQIRESVEGKRR